MHLAFAVLQNDLNTLWGRQLERYVHFKLSQLQIRRIKCE
jgi:hypothetical protein